MTGIAALTMYDRAETAAANDRLWVLIQGELGYGPVNLTRDRNVWEVWQSPDLLFAQTCGYPYRARLHGAVELVGTPDYGVKGCEPGHYCSVIVARADDPRDLAVLAQGKMAYNEPMSQSGWAAPQAHLAASGLSPGSLIQSGAHLNSARMVADGRADFAALDAISWKLMHRWEPFALDLRVVDTTTPTPGLPFIAAKGSDRERLFAAIEAAIAKLDDEDRQTLSLHGITYIPPEAYLAVPIPPDPA